MFDGSYEGSRHTSAELSQVVSFHLSSLVGAARQANTPLCRGQSTRSELHDVITLRSYAIYVRHIAIDHRIIYLRVTPFSAVVYRITGPAAILAFCVRV